MHVLPVQRHGERWQGCLISDRRWLYISLIIQINYCGRSSPRGVFFVTSHDINDITATFCKSSKGTLEAIFCNVFPEVKNSERCSIGPLHLAPHGTWRLAIRHDDMRNPKLSGLPLSHLLHCASFPNERRIIGRYISGADKSVDSLESFFKFFKNWVAIIIKKARDFQINRFCEIDCFRITLAHITAFRD